MEKKFFILINLVIMGILFEPILANKEELIIVNKEKRNKNSYYENFKDLLLVINFNNPHYSNIPFLKELYSPIFKNIVFYGEKPNPDVLNVYTESGLFLTNVLMDVIIRFPDYSGYLVLQDDCVLNYWNLLSLDKNKIWHTTKLVYYGAGINVAKLYSGEYVAGFFWPCWGKPYNVGIPVFIAMQEAYKTFSVEEKLTLAKNIGEGNVAANTCDFFYFPARFKAEMLRLCSACKIVEHEAALPTIFCSLDLINNWENLDISTGIGYINAKNYPIKSHWVHPVKFSDLNKRTVMLEIFNDMLK